MPESVSARKKTLATSARMLASRLRWTTLAKPSTAISVALIPMHTSCRRSAGPMTRRSSYRSDTKAVLPRGRRLSPRYFQALPRALPPRTTYCCAICAILLLGVEPMTHVTYQIVEHVNCWAYTVDGVFSEPYPIHAEALAAARTAAAEQRVPGHTEVIEYEDESGHWSTETASGCDRPETDVQDTN